MTGSAEKYPKIMNPLWVISLFLSTSEVIAGIAATQVDGSNQAILVWFCVLFPLFVASVFFLIVWKKPYVLYAPKDFSGSTSVEGYVTAMQSASLKAIHTTRSAQVSIERSITTAVTTAVADLNQVSSANVGVGESERIVSSAVDAAHREINADFVTIDIDDLDPDAPPILFPADSRSRLQDLLNYIFFNLEPSVSVFSYAEEWLLVTEDGTAIAKNGRIDARTLGRLGIRNGTTLRAVRLRESTRDNAPQVLVRHTNP